MVGYFARHNTCYITIQQGMYSTVHCQQIRIVDVMYIWCMERKILYTKYHIEQLNSGNGKKQTFFRVRLPIYQPSTESNERSTWNTIRTHTNIIHIVNVDGCLMAIASYSYRIDLYLHFAW